MYLLGKKSKKRSIFTGHDLGTNNIFSLNHEQLIESVKNEYKILQNFVKTLSDPINLYDIYANLDNMSLSVGKRVTIKNWLERNGIEYQKLGILPNYSWNDIVGSGSFSSVHLVNNKITKYPEYKVVKLTKLKNDRDNIMGYREIDVLRKISHPYIVKLYDFGLKDDYLWCLLEYCYLGSLLNFGLPLTYNLRYRCLSHCVEGISYLHNKKIIHRDIKSGNIFIKGEDPHIMFKLGDFNLAKDTSNVDSAKWSKCGTFNYMAPELVSNQEYNEKCDLWSLLCVLLEINLGPKMFNPLVITTEELKAKAEFSETELGIIDKLHKINPAERITANELYLYLSENPYNSPNLQLSTRTLTRIRSASFDIDRQDLKNI
jgi:serine/threonine protein kinase